MSTPHLSDNEVNEPAIATTRGTFGWLAITVSILLGILAVFVALGMPLGVDMPSWNAILGAVISGVVLLALAAILRHPD